MTKKRMIIEFNDFINLPFEEIDIEHFKDLIQEAISDYYQIRITDLKIEKGEDIE
jgi:hypothetical protein